MAPPNSLTELSSLTVLSYNVFMRPTSAFANDQAVRVGFLPNGVRAADVLVFQELFDNTIRTRLTKSLADTHPHRTLVTGRASGTIDNGGVVIYSKHAIEKTCVKLFGSVSTGADAHANKGIRYVRVQKAGRRYHVFGTHLQAGGGGERANIRRTQLTMLKAFIDSQRIPATDVVLIAGDLNVGHTAVDGRVAEAFSSMLRILNAEMPAQHTGGEFSHQDGKRLDYVLVSCAHRKPVASSSAILRLTYPGGNLSDHFAVDSKWSFV